MKTPAQVAQALVKIYRRDFGGKDKGRYQISRAALRELSERGRLEDTTLAAITQEAYDRGFVLTDMGDDFSIIEKSVMSTYRRVPARVIAEYVSKRKVSKREEP